MRGCPAGRAARGARVVDLCRRRPRRGRVRRSGPRSRRRSARSTLGGRRGRPRRRTRCPTPRARRARTRGGENHRDALHGRAPHHAPIIAGHRRRSPPRPQLWAPVAPVRHTEWGLRLLAASVSRGRRGPSRRSARSRRGRRRHGWSARRDEVAQGVGGLGADVHEMVGRAADVVRRAMTPGTSTTTARKASRLARTCPAKRSATMAWIGRPNAVRSTSAWIPG